MILCEKIVLISQPDDDRFTVAHSVEKHFANSMIRMTNYGKKTQNNTSYWPKSLYKLYRSTRPITKQIDEISLLF